MENFEKERRNWYEKLDSLRTNQEYAYRIEWELKKRAEEKQELKGALDSANVALYTEREQVMIAKQELDHLRVKEREDRRKIMELLSMN